MKLPDLMIAALLVAAPIAHAEEALEEAHEDEQAIEIGSEPAPPAYRDSRGEVHFESEILGTRLCGVMDAPAIGDAFDQGATYVTVCEAD